MDSNYATKGGPARLGYYDNYLVDNASCVIVGVQATPARLSQESAADRDMIERYRERYGYLPQTLAADTTYGNGEMLQWLDERGVAAYHPGEGKSQWAERSLWHRLVHLRARGELLYLPRRQASEIRRHQSAQPHSPLLFNAEALCQLLAEEPLHARQVSEYRYPHLRVSAAARPCPGRDTCVRDLATS